MATLNPTKERQATTGATKDLWHEPAKEPYPKPHDPNNIKNLKAEWEEKAQEGENAQKGPTQGCHGLKGGQPNSQWQKQYTTTTEKNWNTGGQCTTVIPIPHGG